MSKIVRELAKRIKGPMGETEDWWRLMRSEDGSYFVEHEWSHTKLKTLKTDAGTRSIPIDEFLGGDTPNASKARAVLQAMKDQGEI